MIPYLHEKIQEIRWSRFLENRLTNSLTHWLHINYYSTKLIGSCPLGTGVQNQAILILQTMRHRGSWGSVAFTIVFDFIEVPYSRHTKNTIRVGFNLSRMIKVIIEVISNCFQRVYAIRHQACLQYIFILGYHPFWTYFRIKEVLFDVVLYTLCTGKSIILISPRILNFSVITVII